MKKERILSAALMAAITLGIAVSCAKQDPAPVDNPIDNPQEQVKTNPSVISANIPEEITKVAISDNGVRNGMSLAWEAGDAIRVIATAGGSGNESFSIKSGFTATQAEFEGTAVAGTAFTVFYPAKYADVTAINARSYVSQEQDGNGSVAHLEWNAIEDVADYGTVTFSNKQNGALRFTLQLPDAFTKVYSMSLYATNGTDAPLSVFSTTNGGGATTDHLDLNLKDGANSYITLGADKVLTAYMMVSWNDNALPTGTKLLIKVKGDQDEPWVKTKEVASAFTIAGGKVTNIKLNDDNWGEPLFWGGDGTQTNPYIIKTAYHLRNVKAVMDAAADHTVPIYFKLDENIDLGGAEWIQVNQLTDDVEHKEHFTWAINFDGNYKTISNFVINPAASGVGVSSFFGEISGEVKNLKFSTATITAGGNNGSAGVLCGIANNLTATNVDAEDVDITIVRSPGETAGVGGLIGYAIGSTVSGCDLTGCDIIIGKRDDNPAKDAEPQNVGGLIGRLRADASSVTSCSVSNATLAALYCAGGLIGKVGCTTGPVDIKGNSTSGMTVSFSNAQADSKQGAGGLIGCIEATGDPAVAVNIGDASNTNTVSSLTIDQTQGYVGGVVGNIMDGNVTITKATVGGTVKTTGWYAAGVLGRSSKAVSISYCDVDATVSAGMGAGGVLAYTYDSAANISHCTVAGSVTATSTSGDTKIDGLVEYSHVGGIAGFAMSTSSKIEYCDVTANVTGKAAVGGITGRNKGGTIDHCTYKTGTITGTDRVGGISGANTGAAGTITNCEVSNGAIITNTGSNTGGILGRNHNAGTSVSYCDVTATINGTSNIGGIVGESGTTMTVSDCDVNCTVSEGSGSYLGGVMGSFAGGDNTNVLSVSISGCTVSGSLSTTGHHVSGILGGCQDAGNSNVNGQYKSVSITSCSTSANLGGNQNVAGIIGRARYHSEITSCSASGTYTSTKVSDNSYAGGLTGCTGEAIITKSSSTATVIGKKMCGGLVASAHWGDLEMSECYYNGTLNFSASQNGGLVGRVENGKTLTISNCYSAGSLTSPGGYSGSFIGYVIQNATLNIYNSYSSMNISVTANNVNSVGALVGGADNTTAKWDIDKCLAWNTKINFATAYETVGVIVGQIHSGASSASTSLKNCWYANDLDCTFACGRALRDDADITSSPGKKSYDGKRAASGVSCQDKATELVWNSTIWKLDNTDGYPTLKNVAE
ncbi:MAG: hypothetical protein J6W09_11505 [Bacteroidales bacterium]|nr:hypothetical protein [Bacteroidales bacterium]